MILAAIEAIKVEPTGPVEVTLGSIRIPRPDVAIARVNRVFGSKLGSLVVGYLGLAHELKRAPPDARLAEVRGLPQRNLAVELLQKLLHGELAVRRRKNVVQARSFAEMLERTLRKYQNRAIEAAQGARIDGVERVLPPYLEATVG